MIKYDKLKNVETEEKLFNFKCPECNVNGFEKGNFDINPLGISWKPDLIDNSDIKNKTVRQSLDNLPTLREALEKVMSDKVDSSNLSIYCNHCKTELTIRDKIKKSDIRKWMNNNLPSYLDLRLKR